MNCLTKEELIFFILHDFQTDIEHSAVQKHLDSCYQCSREMKLIEKDIEEIVKRNKKECDLVLENIQDYIEGKTFIVNDLNIADHLAECEGCNYLYQLLKKEVTLEKVNDIDIPIPEELTDSIEQLLRNIQVENNSMDNKEIGETLTEVINDLVDRIILKLIPAPAPAFLTEIISGEREIELSGGDVMVNVGEPGRAVKIFSHDNIQLGRQISDNSGEVVFKNFLHGTYKIMVEGFEIKEVKYQK